MGDGLVKLLTWKVSEIKKNMISTCQKTNISSTQANDFKYSCFNVSLISYTSKILT